MARYYIDIDYTRAYFIHRPPHYGVGRERGGFWRNAKGIKCHPVMLDWVGFNQIPWC